MQITKDKHQLTLRLLKPLYGSMQRWKTNTGQSITSQLIETAIKTESVYPVNLFSFCPSLLLTKVYDHDNHNPLDTLLPYPDIF